MIEFTRGAEVARTLEGQPVARHIAIENAKAGKPHVGRKPLRECSLGAEGEEIGMVDDLPRRSVVEEVDADPLLGISMRVKEADRCRRICHDGAIGPIGDVHLGIEIDPLEHLASPDEGRHIGFCGKRTCIGGEPVEVERLGRPEIEPFIPCECRPGGAQRRQ